MHWARGFDIYPNDRAAMMGRYSGNAWCSGHAREYRFPCDASSTNFLRLRHSASMLWRLQGCGSGKNLVEFRACTRPDERAFDSARTIDHYDGWKRRNGVQWRRKHD